VNWQCTVWIARETVITSIKLSNPEDGGSWLLRTVGTKLITRLETLTAMLLLIRVFWHVTPCRWASHHATLTPHWKPEKNICHVVSMIWGLIVLPDNILGEKVVLLLPAVYPLHIQESIKYADISVNRVWRNIWHCVRQSLNILVSTGVASYTSFESLTLEGNFCQ
jgi:hypothetical protein